MDIGKLLIFIGSLLILAGIGFLFLPKIIPWFGNLPGDIRIERTNTNIYIPITSMILSSVLITVLVNIILWLITKFK